MKRDYSRFNSYLENLSDDIYLQPSDPGHTSWAKAFLDWSLPIVKPSSLLDVGCGDGFCKPLVESHGSSWEGVTIGDDLEICSNNNLPVYGFDMSFLSFPDNYCDVILSRHSLEHSPFPILTLMEWKRVVKGHLLVVLPAWEYWGYGGRNHYAVLNKEQWWYNFSRSGWGIIHEKEMTTEDKIFMDVYLPHIEGKDREGLKHPGAPQPVEYWYILEQTEERKE